MQLSLCCRRSCCKGDGLPENHYLHIGYGKRCQYPRCGLDLCRSCRWKALDRDAQAKIPQAPEQMKYRYEKILREVS